MVKGGENDRTSEGIKAFNAGRYDVLIGEGALVALDLTAVIAFKPGKPDGDRETALAAIKGELQQRNMQKQTTTWIDELRRKAYVEVKL